MNDRRGNMSRILSDFVPPFRGFVPPHSDFVPLHSNFVPTPETRTFLRFVYARVYVFNEKTFTE